MLIPGMLLRVRRGDIIARETETSRQATYEVNDHFVVVGMDTIWQGLSVLSLRHNRVIVFIGKPEGDVYYFGTMLRVASSHPHMADLQFKVDYIEETEAFEVC